MKIYILLKEDNSLKFNNLLFLISSGTKFAGNGMKKSVFIMIPPLAFHSFVSVSFFDVCLCYMRNAAPACLLTRDP